MVSAPWARLATSAAMRNAAFCSIRPKVFVWPVGMPKKRPDLSGLTWNVRGLWPLSLSREAAMHTTRYNHDQMDRENVSGLPVVKRAWSLGRLGYVLAVNAGLTTASFM